MKKIPRNRLYKFLEDLGEYTIQLINTFRAVFTFATHLQETFKQSVRLGINSLPITSVTLAFVGMVFTTQVCKEFTKLGAGKMVGGIVGLAVWRELGPLLAGVVVAGRVGAAIAAELGSMKVTEQVDALETMAVDPIDFLVAPRFLAVVFMMPIMIIFADFIGWISGFFVYVNFFHGNPYAYITSASQMLIPKDIWGGILIKGLVFGLIIASIASYIGLKTKGGAQGVGVYTTKAVVYILMVLFVANYFLSIFLF